MSSFLAQTDEFLDNFLSDVLSKNTKKVITGGVKLLVEFLVANNVEVNIDEINLKDLDKYLRIFFGSIKKSSQDDVWGEGCNACLFFVAFYPDATVFVYITINFSYK